MARTLQPLRRGAVYLLLAVALCGCATTDSGISRGLILIPKSMEVALGREISDAVIKQYGEYPDPAVAAYVNEVGQRLVAVSDRKDLEYTFRALDTPIVNAFAAPGGFIFVTRGLLERVENEAELAAIEGHELGHVAAYHSVKKLQAMLGYTIIAAVVMANSEEAQKYEDFATIAFNLIMLGYSRSDEYQADQLGLYYSAHAGYDPYQMTTFFQKLLDEGGDLPRLLVWLSSHPRTSDRIERIPTIVQQFHLDQNQTPELGDVRYQQIVRSRLDGNVRNQVMDAFQLMLEAFRGEDLDEFMKHVARDYNHNGENYAALRAREEKFFSEAENIGIELGQVNIDLRGLDAVLTYDYALSYTIGEETFESAGVQELTYRRDGEEWLMIALDSR